MEELKSCLYEIVIVVKLVGLNSEHKTNRRRRKLLKSYYKSFEETRVAVPIHYEMHWIEWARRCEFCTKFMSFLATVYIMEDKTHDSQLWYRFCLSHGSDVSSLYTISFSKTLHSTSSIPLDDMIHLSPLSPLFDPFTMQSQWRQDRPFEPQ